MEDHTAGRTPDEKEALQRALTRLDEIRSHVRRLVAMSESREIIGRAEGILMERYTIDADQAQTLLFTASKDSGTTLKQTAAALIDSRALPKPESEQHHDA